VWPFKKEQPQPSKASPDPGEAPNRMIGIPFRGEEGVILSDLLQKHVSDVQIQNTLLFMLAERMTLQQVVQLPEGSVVRSAIFMIRTDRLCHTASAALDTIAPFMGSRLPMELVNHSHLRIVTEVIPDILKELELVRDTTIEMQCRNLQAACELFYDQIRTQRRDLIKSRPSPQSKGPGPNGSDKISV